MMRWVFCGTIGSGSITDPHRPACCRVVGEDHFDAARRMKDGYWLAKTEVVGGEDLIEVNADNMATIRATLGLEPILERRTDPERMADSLSREAALRRGGIS